MKNKGMPLIVLIVLNQLIMSIFLAAIFYLMSIDSLPIFSNEIFINIVVLISVIVGLTLTIAIDSFVTRINAIFYMLEKKNG